jgi:hypothetical protein
MQDRSALPAFTSYTNVETHAARLANAVKQVGFPNDWWLTFGLWRNHVFSGRMFKTRQREQIIVVGIHGAHHVVGKSEPKRRGRIDLRGVCQQRVGPSIVIITNIQTRADAMVSSRNFVCNASARDCAQVE